MGKHRAEPSKSLALQQYLEYLHCHILVVANKREREKERERERERERTCIFYRNVFFLLNFGHFDVFHNSSTSQMFMVIL